MPRLEVHPADAGLRLDVWLSRQFPEHSRSKCQQLIRQGHVRVDDEACKPHHPVAGREEIDITFPPPAPVDILPENIPLDILYEDTDLLVLNKPPGLVVHPAPGHPRGTLVNALLYHCSDLAGIGGELRPGIVHRLDKDTSGVMVTAKNEEAMSGLVDQFKERRLDKEYVAVVWGHPRPAESTIVLPIGRHQADRKKMSVHTRVGRNAHTAYRVRERYPEHALVEVKIETGRTHQIRVHLAHIGHPVVGDPVYGIGPKREEALPAPRQMLHACRLRFSHPRSGTELDISAPMPDDMRELIDFLKGP